ncbi:MAG: hypothetical protein ACRDVP_11450 [Acidimicrobiales bacterium]
MWSSRAVESPAYARAVVSLCPLGAIGVLRPVAPVPVGATCTVGVVLSVHCSDRTGARRNPTSSRWSGARSLGGRYPWQVRARDWDFEMGLDPERRREVAGRVRLDNVTGTVAPRTSDGVIEGAGQPGR